MAARQNLPEQALAQARRDIREASARLTHQRTLSAAISPVKNPPSPTPGELVRDVKSHQAEFERRLRDANAYLDVRGLKKS